MPSSPTSIKDTLTADIVDIIQEIDDEVVFQEEHEDDVDIQVAISEAKDFFGCSMAGIHLNRLGKDFSGVKVPYQRRRSNEKEEIAVVQKKDSKYPFHVTVPLISPDGHYLGHISVADETERELTTAGKQRLRDISNCLVLELVTRG